MKISHIAIWVQDLERMKDFYEMYFSARAGEKYHNPAKSFTSYFLSFPENEVKLELMHSPAVPVFRMLFSSDLSDQRSGLIHFAISLGSRDEVLVLTDRIRQEGYKVIGEPRETGDGYFESVVLDPEGNMLELTV